MKKILFTSFIVLILSASFALYYWVQKEKVNSENGSIQTLPLSSSKPEVITGNSRNDTNPDIASTTDSVFSGEDFTSREKAIGPYLLTSKGKEAIFYVDKEIGHLFQVEGKNIKKLSNETLPRPQEAYLIPDEKGLIYGLRYEKDGKLINKWFILSGFNPFGSSTPNYTIKDFDLPIGFYTLSVSPDYKKLFYLIRTPEGSEGYTLEIKTKKQQKIFSSRLSEWKISWINNDNISLQTKNSHSVGGYLYLLNLKTGKLTKELSNINGLTSLVSPDANKIIYSVTYQGEPYLYLKDRLKNTQIKLGLKSLSDKCTWTRDSLGLYCAIPKNLTSSNYPDDWYKGKNTSQDQIWSVDSSTGETLKMVDFSVIKLAVDVSSLIITQDKHLYFSNKIDGLLRNIDLGISY